jgi:hypothetical protein
VLWSRIIFVLRLLPDYTAVSACNVSKTYIKIRAESVGSGAAQCYGSEPPTSSKFFGSGCVLVIRWVILEMLCLLSLWADILFKKMFVTNLTGLFNVHMILI